MNDHIFSPYFPEYFRIELFFNNLNNKKEYLFIQKKIILNFATILEVDS